MKAKLNVYYSNYSKDDILQSFAVMYVHMLSLDMQQHYEIAVT